MYTNRHPFVIETYILFESTDPKSLYELFSFFYGCFLFFRRFKTIFKKLCVSFNKE
uniref:Uncharacterized protein n=1 Tax=Anguilla anguilla TaxID=7936 RepID=A0A0E9QS26_ANGAN